MPARRKRLVEQILAKEGNEWYTHVSAHYVCSLIASAFVALSQNSDMEWPEATRNRRPAGLDNICHRLRELIWLEGLHFLCFARNGQHFTFLCKCCLEVLLIFLIPPHTRWMRKIEPLQRLTATLFATTSLVWLKGNLACKLASRMWPLLPGTFHTPLQGDLADATGLIGWFRTLFSGNSWGNDYCLYAWLSKCFEYIGIAKLRRTRNDGIGPVQRLFEHLAASGPSCRFSEIQTCAAHATMDLHVVSSAPGA